MPYPLNCLKELDVERVSGQLAFEPDERVTRGHGLDEGGVQRQLCRVRDHLLELVVLRLAHARQVQVALRQGARLKLGKTKKGTIML